MPSSSLIGLSLEDARDVLGATPFGVVEMQASPSRAAAPVWGQARVLRVRETDDGLELLVAREMLRDERAPQIKNASERG